MALLEYAPVATGGPGIEPRWTHSAKDIVGTAYSTSSRIWFTVSRGVLSEIYFPRWIGRRFATCSSWSPTARASSTTPIAISTRSIEYLGEHGLGVRITNSDPRRPLPARRRGHRRSASALRADRYAGSKATRISCASSTSMCCSRRISRSADGATTAMSPRSPGASF